MKTSTILLDSKQEYKQEYRRSVNRFNKADGDLLLGRFCVYLYVRKQDAETARTHMETNRDMERKNGEQGFSAKLVWGGVGFQGTKWVEEEGDPIPQLGGRYRALSPARERIQDPIPHPGRGYRTLLTRQWEDTGP